jgi:folate-dependent phosphoribosylglycinamide formyltransferase PurN
MTESQTDHSQPIRVVLFGGGPVLERSVKQFICRLEDHPEIEFLGGFVQSDAQTFRAIVVDLFRRRHLFAVLLLVMQMLGIIRRYIVYPFSEIKLNQKFAKISDRIQYVPDIHAEDVLENLGSLSPDLGLLYSSPILKPKLFEIPSYGTLGIHHGKVPEYRGKKTTFWAMYNGEKTVGVTIQKINPALDTGDIVKSGEVVVGGRSLRSVWNELEMLGFDLFIRAILEVKEGTATYRPQIGKKGKLYYDPKFGDILRFWRRRLKITSASFGI